jgi:hypothetical protein
MPDSRRGCALPGVPAAAHVADEPAARAAPRTAVQTARGAGQRTAARVGPRLDTTGPVGLVDWTGVPGRFCRWIRRCWERVWNVFSCRLQKLMRNHACSSLRIPYQPTSLQTGMWDSAHFGAGTCLDVGAVVLLATHLNRTRAWTSIARAKPHPIEPPVPEPCLEPGVDRTHTLGC